MYARTLICVIPVLLLLALLIMLKTPTWSKWLASLVKEIQTSLEKGGRNLEKVFKRSGKDS